MPFCEGTAGQTAQEQDVPDREHQIVARRELERERRDRGCRHRHRQRQDADEAAIDGHHGGQPDRGAGFAALGQRIAVERGCNSRPGAGDVQQDRAASATVDAAQEDARDQREAGSTSHLKVNGIGIGTAIVTDRPRIAPVTSHVAGHPCTEKNADSAAPPTAIR